MATVTGPVQAEHGGVMAKRHSRPSTQYRYEHYDPFRLSWPVAREHPMAPPAGLDRRWPSAWNGCGTWRET